jgi:uncharacterized glyoxalase superfamily protein PhnB
MMECSCCGHDREPVVTLQCHEDVKICRDCIGWLRAKAGIVDSTPILPVADMAASAEFYEAAGFDVRRYEGGDYAFVTYDGASVFDLDAVEPALDKAANNAGCYLISAEAGSWHQRLSSLGLPVSEFEDKPWGMREFTLTDPSGNYVRVGRSRDE